MRGPSWVPCALKAAHTAATKDQQCQMLFTGLVDEARVAVIGGSHGGFLTGNLVGQHPGCFRCGVLRNPVMDLSLMISVSDIPDWCFVEATGSKVTLPAYHLSAGLASCLSKAKGGGEFSYSAAAQSDGSAGLDTYKTAVGTPGYWAVPAS